MLNLFLCQEQVLPESKSLLLEKGKIFDNFDKGPRSMGV